MRKICILNIKAFCFAAGLFTFSLLALPTFAHADNGPIIFGEHNGWTTGLDRNPGGTPFCMVSSNMVEGGMIAMVTTPDQTFLSIQDPVLNEPQGSKLSIDAKLNGDDFTGTVTAAGNNTVVLPVNKQFVQDFITGNQALITLDHNMLWAIDLSGTNLAANDMESCISQMMNR